MMPPDNFSETLARIEDKVDAIGRWIHGSEGSPGVNVRIDRLEQRDLDAREREKARTGLIWTSLAAGVTALGGMIVKVISSSGPTP